MSDWSDEDEFYGMCMYRSFNEHIRLPWESTTNGTKSGYVRAAKDVLEAKGKYVDQLAELQREFERADLARCAMPPYKLERKLTTVLAKLAYELGARVKK